MSTYYSSYQSSEWLSLLEGQRVVDASDNTITLSDGKRLTFDSEADDCCSWIELQRLATTDNVITKATLEDNEDETGGEGSYRAWLHVITEADELNIAEAVGDASNGYYLHGFALGVRVHEPEGAGDAS